VASAYLALVYVQVPNYARMTDKRFFFLGTYYSKLTRCLHRFNRI
jgi:hypothetical protein